MRSESLVKGLYSEKGFFRSAYEKTSRAFGRYLAAGAIVAMASAYPSNTSAASHVYRLTDDDADQRNLRIGNRCLLWTEWTPKNEIEYLFDLRTGEKTRIISRTELSRASIDENDRYITWVQAHDRTENGKTVYEVVLYDITNKTKSVIFKGNDAPRVTLDGGYIYINIKPKSWLETEENENDSNLFVYDAETRSLIPSQERPKRILNGGKYVVFDNNLGHYVSRFEGKRISVSYDKSTLSVLDKKTGKTTKRSLSFLSYYEPDPFLISPDENFIVFSENFRRPVSLFFPAKGDSGELRVLKDESGYFHSPIRVNNNEILLLFTTKGRTCNELRSYDVRSGQSKKLTTVFGAGDSAANDDIVAWTDWRWGHDPEICIITTSDEFEGRFAHPQPRTPIDKEPTMMQQIELFKMSYASIDSVKEDIVNSVSMSWGANGTLHAKSAQCKGRSWTFFDVTIEEPGQPAQKVPYIPIIFNYPAEKDMMRFLDHCDSVRYGLKE